LDHTGDSPIHWDRNNQGEIDAARAYFDTLKAKGYLAYRTRRDGSRGEVIREFDPTSERIIMSPQLVGG
jgi:hypothetical protein